jgi:antirestriction protein ArdC
MAELTAVCVCVHLGLSSEPRPDHAQYSASWLRVLKADRWTTFTAASKAQQAADFIIQMSEPTAKVAA